MTTTNAMPAPTWAITVDHEAPAMPSESEHQNEFNDHVDDVRADQDDQWRSEVRCAALYSLCCERDDDERHAERSDTQILNGEVQYFVAGTQR